MAKKAKSANTKDPLTKELLDLIPQLDSEGVAFLIEQARVHLYNMQVDELNKAANAANIAAARTAKIAEGKSPRPKDGKLKIAGSESGSSYYLYYKNGDIMFSKDEMIRLVKIVNGPGTDMEIRERLYKWFDRERKDIFAVIPIRDKFDEQLKALVTLLKKNFKVRDS